MASPVTVTIEWPAWFIRRIESGNIPPCEHCGGFDVIVMDAEIVGSNSQMMAIPKTEECLTCRAKRDFK